MQPLALSIASMMSAMGIFLSTVLNMSEISMKIFSTLEQFTYSSRRATSTGSFDTVRGNCTFTNDSLGTLQTAPFRMILETSTLTIPSHNRLLKLLILMSESNWEKLTGSL
ncbi:hypothetical protein WICPIJ_004251 [Wickerhamomyces pijperi]|uniref:Uncharacterized protein n=1 Tax=Wickerhamomyces pijperi TaxID=599730 RepID=A0A9P8Q6A9_WICPI|nr:hypothetical protein WICPIJ_004251 [Wickerhamomyces pijperi]